MNSKTSAGNQNDLGPIADPDTVVSETEFRKMMIVEDLLFQMRIQNITRAELARRIDASPSRVTAILDGSNNLTIETLVRLGRAVGCRLDQRFLPQHAHTFVSYSSFAGPQLRGLSLPQAGKAAEPHFVLNKSSDAESNAA